MKVFRFENREGNGPIVSLADPWSLFKEHRGPRSFPEYKRWVSEKKSWRGIREEGYFFGMKSKELLLGLLVKKDYLRNIEDLGFSIVEYQAADYLVFSDGQVMFKKQNMNIYQENGYEDRQDYLECVSEDYGVPLDLVESLADLLGPDEDFDGLVSTLEDLI